MTGQLPKISVHWAPIPPAPIAVISLAAWSNFPNILPHISFSPYSEWLWRWACEVAGPVTHHTTSVAYPLSNVSPGTTLLQYPSCTNHFFFSPPPEQAPRLGTGYTHPIWTLIWRNAVHINLVISCKWAVATGKKLDCAWHFPTPFMWFLPSRLCNQFYYSYWDHNVRLEISIGLIIS